jgi:hypothetical protein
VNSFWKFEIVAERAERLSFQEFRVAERSSKDKVGIEGIEGIEGKEGREEVSGREGRESDVNELKMLDCLGLLRELVIHHLEAEVKLTSSLSLMLSLVFLSSSINNFCFGDHIQFHRLPTSLRYSLLPTAYPPTAPVTSTAVEPRFDR